MARKVRLQYEGAFYHVISRGNYRSWIFESEGARAAFGVGKGGEEIEADRKSAPWKIAIAAMLKHKTQASTGWIGERLQMGAAKSVSYYVGLLRNGKEGKDVYDQLIQMRKNRKLTPFRLALRLLPRFIVMKRIAGNEGLIQSVTLQIRTNCK